MYKRQALFNAYENKDLSAFLMAICQHSMFDVLRNAALIPFKFNADGQLNPVILTCLLYTSRTGCTNFFCEKCTFYGQGWTSGSMPTKPRDVYQRQECENHVGENDKS